MVHKSLQILFFCFDSYSSQYGTGTPKATEVFMIGIDYQAGLMDLPQNLPCYKSNR